MGERLIFTFALTGRREWEHGTQGVALGYELAALSGRSFSRFVRLSCAHASSLVFYCGASPANDMRPLQGQKRESMSYDER